MLTRTVKEQLVESLRNEIIRGHLKPGDYLRQEDLAARFQVSTMPIREALRVLEAGGLVTIYPHRGAIVTRLSPADLQDIYEMRTALEELATRLAVPYLSAETKISLSTIIREMDTHLDDVLAMVNLNHRFHSSLYAASGRTHLCETLQTLRHRTEHYLYTYISCLGQMPQAQAEHHAILDACFAGDANRAATLINDHVSKVGRTLAQYVKDTGSSVR